jgi:uncharacterized protein YbaR (Trm112 family)
MIQNADVYERTTTKNGYNFSKLKTASGIVDFLRHLDFLIVDILCRRHLDVGILSVIRNAYKKHSFVVIADCWNCRHSRTWHRTVQSIPILLPAPLLQIACE